MQENLEMFVRSLLGAIVLSSIFASVGCGSASTDDDDANSAAGAQSLGGGQTQLGEYTLDSSHRLYVTKVAADRFAFDLRVSDSDSRDAPVVSAVSGEAKQDSKKGSYKYVEGACTMTFSVENDSTIKVSDFAGTTCDAGESDPVAGAYKRAKDALPNMGTYGSNGATFEVLALLGNDDTIDIALTVSNSTKSGGIDEVSAFSSKEKPTHYSLKKGSCVLDISFSKTAAFVAEADDSDCTYFSNGLSFGGAYIDFKAQ